MVATAQLEIVQNWPKKDLLNYSCGKRITEILSGVMYETLEGDREEKTEKD